MQIYKYWVKETKELKVGDELKKFVFFGGSNNSVEEARERVNERAEKIKMKIEGKLVKKEDYTVEIREEISKEIDKDNIVTRNRYGALVLNTTELTIIDIDEHKKSWLEIFGLKKRDKKEAIISDLEKMIKKTEYNNIGFRIYETHNGIRVIVLGKYFIPGTAEFKKMMSRCNSDYLYVHMCVRQNCYRARLTPKPGRMRFKTIKYVWPMPEEDKNYAKNWVKDYEEKSKNYAVCKYIKTIGKEAYFTKTIDYHDELTKAMSDLKLV